MKIEDKIDWAQILFAYGMTILFIIIAAVVTVSIEIKFAIIAIAIAYFSHGVAVLHSKRIADRLLKYHSENTEKQILELGKKIDDLSKKSKWRGKKKS